MIAEPLSTRIHVVLAASGLTADDINMDTIAIGPGASSQRRVDPATNVNASLLINLKASIGHTVSKLGRRRSVFRFDSFMSPGAITTADTVSRTASAYLVVDVADNPLPEDTVAADSALSALINSLVTSRAGGSSFVAAQALKDFLNGEA